jgi:hypothetical protein
MNLVPALLSALEGARAALPVKARPFSADALIAHARRATGLQDFGDEGFLEGLHRFLDACTTEARLGLIGRQATKWDTVRFLSNLLQMAEAEAAEPSITRQAVPQPFFITGLPRSGTSFLHKLLMEDEANHVPRVWQLIYPYPTAGQQSGGPDNRIEQVNRQLRTFERMAPDFPNMHPIDATSPQECSEITAHVFASLRFDTTYRIPSYLDWLDNTGHLSAYRFHKRFLQHLQHQSPGHRRWFLKCPDHVFAMDDIASVYPDANVVFVHRDPLKVLPSVARLTEVLRRPFSREVDRADIGRQISTRWLDGAEQMVAADQTPRFARPIFHLQYRDLIRDPLTAVTALYEHFGLTLAPETAARIAGRVTAQPKGGYGDNRYRFEDFDIDPARQRDLFGAYTKYYDVAHEV